jgi:lipid A oxidase
MRANWFCLQSPGTQPSSLLRGGLAAAFVAASITASAETTISGYLGDSWTRSSDLRVSQSATDSDATFQGVSWDSKSFQAPPYYGLRFTQFFESYSPWGIAFDFTHYKIYARTGDVVAFHGRWNGAPVDETAPLAERVQRFSISHGVNYVGPLVLYRIGFIESTAFSEGRLQAYVGVGPIYYIDHPESTVNGLAAERYEGSGWGWQSVAGLRYRLTEHWSAFGEFKYDQGRATVIVAGDGSANTRLRTGHAIFGVGYSF